MCDLFDEEVFEQKFNRIVTGYQKRFGDLLQYDPKEEIERFKVSLRSSYLLCRTSGHTERQESRPPSYKPHTTNLHLSRPSAPNSPPT